MKFTCFPKFALLSVLAGVFALILTGCGASSNLALTQGNWSMTATPSAGATFNIGGNLTQSGTNLAGTMYVIGFPNCYSSSQTVAFTGTVKGKNVTLTSGSVGGQVISIIATGTAGSLAGTYTIAGGTTCNGDSGTLTATPVPSISATWSGPIVDANGDNVILSMALTQAATASPDGTFALTGNLTYTGSTCSVSGTLPAGSAFIAGTYIVMQGNTIEFDGSPGTFTYYPAFLNNPTLPVNMQGTYTQTFGVCTDNAGNAATFTKQ
jgi:hypothetical protein